MGRRKIQIKPIVDDRNRSVTFLKRKNGLMKKAYELGVLCGADVAVIVFAGNGKLYEFSSGDLNTTLLRYSNHEGPPHEHRGPADFDGTKPKGSKSHAASAAAASSSGPVQGSSSGAGAGKKDTGDEDDDDDDDAGDEGSDLGDVKVEDSRSVKEDHHPAMSSAPQTANWAYLNAPHPSSAPPTTNPSLPFADPSAFPFGFPHVPGFPPPQPGPPTGYPPSSAAGNPYYAAYNAMASRAGPPSAPPTSTGAGPPPPPGFPHYPFHLPPNPTGGSPFAPPPPPHHPQQHHHASQAPFLAAAAAAAAAAAEAAYWSSGRAPPGHPQQPPQSHPMQHFFSQGQQPRPGVSNGPTLVPIPTHQPKFDFHALAAAAVGGSSDHQQAPSSSTPGSSASMAGPSTAGTTAKGSRKSSGKSTARKDDHDDGGGETDLAGSERGRPRPRRTLTPEKSASRGESPASASNAAGRRASAVPPATSTATSVAPMETIIMQKSRSEPLGDIPVQGESHEEQLRALKEFLPGFKFDDGAEGRGEGGSGRAEEGGEGFEWPTTG